MFHNKAEIESLISSPSTKVVSFDFFDTLLLRPLMSPEDLFLILEHESAKLTPSVDLIRLAVFRKEAENTANRNALRDGRQEASITEIYAILQEMTSLPTQIINEIYEKELELVRKYSYERKSGLRLYQLAKQYKKAIIVVADTCLPSELLRQILMEYGFDEPDKIYVSSECGLSKKQGDLYDYICADLHMKACEMLQIGSNEKADVMNPRRHGWMSSPFYKPLDMLMNGIPFHQYGNAYKHSYKEIRSTISNLHALDYLGNRCMITVAANMVYDDPYCDQIRKGDYCGNASLFGAFALGMYCLAQGIWVSRLTKEEDFQHVLFFSRDGFLPFLAYQEISKYISLPECNYVSISRKAILPLLLSDKQNMLAAGNHLKYRAHTPQSIVLLLSSVLRKDKLKTLQQSYANLWTEPFETEYAMISFLRKLRCEYVDRRNMKAAEKNFEKYFAPYMRKKILTYDVGYSLRNEIMLHTYFPDTEIIAAFTHESDDIPQRRREITGIEYRTFYACSPYVSWLIRELFLSENAASCIGYSDDGTAKYEKMETSSQILKRDIQNSAIKYIRDYVYHFKDDIAWMPVMLDYACLPLETFLHSPCRTDRKWVQSLDSENDAGRGVDQTTCYVYWRKFQTDYLIAYYHIGGLARHAIRFLMLFGEDKRELKKLIRLRFRKQSS